MVKELDAMYVSCEMLLALQTLPSATPDISLAQYMTSVPVESG